MNEKLMRVLTNDLLEMAYQVSKHPNQTTGGLAGMATRIHDAVALLDNAAQAEGGYTFTPETANRFKLVSLLGLVGAAMASDVWGLADVNPVVYLSAVTADLYDSTELGEWHKHAVDALRDSGISAYTPGLIDAAPQAEKWVPVMIQETTAQALIPRMDALLIYLPPAMSVLAVREAEIARRANIPIVVITHRFYGKPKEWEDLGDVTAVDTLADAMVWLSRNIVPKQEGK